MFGGLYLPHLRQANYRSLLVAENAATAGRGLTVQRLDFDGDGKEEVLVSSPSLNCYLHSMGGQIFELDARATPWNLLATLARHRERYQDQVGDADYDWYPRRALADHFFREDTTRERFAACRYGEQGDFVDRPYQVQVEERGPEVAITLRRDGGVWVGQEFLPVTVRKRITLSAGASRLAVEYWLEQSSGRSLPLWFGCESNFVLSSGNAPGRYYRFGQEQRGPALDATEARSAVGELELVDEWLGLGIRLKFEHPPDVWTFPIETLSQDLDGWSRSYQASCITAHWRLNLLSGQPWRVSFTIAVDEVDRQNG